MTRRRSAVVAGLLPLLLGGSPATARNAADVEGAALPPSASSWSQPLGSKVIVIDAGHQLGNATHPRKTSRLVNAGGFLKPCNSTGTATNGGFPEATLTWRVSKVLRRQLEARGARLYFTRHTNSHADWGPCVDTRGRKGNKVHADAVISVHGDGTASSTRGFFVIMPSNREGWTDDIYRSSHRYGLKVRRGLTRAGVRVSNAYGGDGLDVRGDLGTLDWSNRPAVMVELGNMRNATDARHMRSPGVPTARVRPRSASRRHRLRPAPLTPLPFPSPFAANRGGGRTVGGRGQEVVLSAASSAARPLSSRATGTRNGEHDT